MSQFEDVEIISQYTRQQAIEDGILVEVFDEYIMKGLSEFTNGRQIVATTHLAQEMEKHDLRDIWNRFAVWKQDVEPTLSEEERLFHTVVNGKKSG
jgi:hypothetical protein